MPANFSVRVTGLDWWQKRVYYLSTGGLEREGAMPVLKDLDRKFRATLSMLFKPGGGPGETYKHGHTGRYLLGLYSIVTPDTLKIIEGRQTGGQEIREGGKVGNWADIAIWAREKLGLEKSDAEDVADALVKRGYVGGGNSPMRNEYPEGVGKFAFPEWMVKVKHRDDLEKASRSVESLIVRYLR